MKLEFPAMRGVMGGEVYYSAMIQIKNVPTLFDTYLDKKVIQVEERMSIDMKVEAQRRLNQKRVPEISEYILSHLKKSPKGYGYVFNSITVNSEGNLKFKEFAKGKNIGTLTVENFEKFTVADGQHRLMGIKHALAKTKDKAFKEETITVVFIDVRDSKGKADVSRMHQVFTDLNRNAQKVQGGVLAAMGGKPNEIIARRLIEEVGFFADRVEMEKNSPSRTSDHLLSLKAIKDCVDIQFGATKKIDIDSNLNKAKQLWTQLWQIIEPWKKFNDDELDATVIKTDYVCTHSVVLRSLTAVMTRIDQLPEAQKRKSINELKNMNWKKSNPFFKGKILTDDGGMINNKTSERALIKALSKKLGVEDGSIDS